MQIGYLPDKDVLLLEEAVKAPQKFTLPVWMLNRRNDYETGETLHLTESDLVMKLRDDLNRMKKTRNYRKETRSRTTRHGSEDQVDLQERFVCWS